MNTPKSSKKSYIIVGILALLAIMIYFYWTGNKAPESLTIEELNNANIAIGARVLELLNEINSLKIDTAFFKDVSYQTLRDYSVGIPSLPVGRPNPLAPVPGMVIPSTGR